MSKSRDKASPGLTREHDRAETLDRLRHAHEIMQFVMDALPSFVFWKDRDCVYLGCNGNFARVAGVSAPSEIVGKTDYDLAWKKQEADFFVEVDRRVMEADEPKYRFIEPQRHADGKQAWLETSKAPLHDADGNIVGIMGCYDDITERMEAERKLRESEQLYRLLAENTSDLIWLCGLPEENMPVLYISPVVEELLGYSAEELQQRSLLDVFVDDTHRNVRSSFATIAAQGEQPPFVARLVHKNGDVIDCEVLARPVRDKSGRTTSFRGRISDIRERLQAERERASLEKQLRQSQKLEAIGQLAGGVAHDFNNLLTGIMGYVDLSMPLVSAELGADHELVSNLEAIERASVSAASLTRQLLTLSRRGVVELQVLDLNAVLKNLKSLLKRLITENVVMRTKLDPELKSIRADAGYLEQVIINLVVNAAQAMNNGGDLALETENVNLDEEYVDAHSELTAGRYVMLSVSDTGHGMDKATLDRIFEPFFTTKFQDRGTGLGLATVHGIVKQVGGEVNVYSEPGVGTTFKLYFPAVDELPSARRASTLPSVERGDETVLLCEDNDSVRELVASILRAAGYTPIVASNGRALLEMLSAHTGSVDLLLTDVIMRGMNGRELAGEVAKMRKVIPVLYISGYTSNVIARHGVLDAGVRFLAKPFTRRELLTKVRAVIDESKAP